MSRARRCHRIWWSIQVRSVTGLVAHAVEGHLCLRAQWDRVMIEVLCEDDPCTQSSCAPRIGSSLWRDWDQ